MTELSLPADPRPSARVALLRWLLMTLVFTGVIAMHILSQHDAASGHHGAMIDQSAMAMGGPSAQLNHDLIPPATAVPPATPILQPVQPAADIGSMAACVLFLVIGAGAAVVALLAELRRFGIQTFATSGSATLRTVIPRGPPSVGPPRFSLCVLRI